MIAFGFLLVSVGIALAALARLSAAQGMRIARTMLSAAALVAVVEGVLFVFVLTS